jgi:hypothetical protein
MVQGAEASVILVTQTLRDLRAQPFNDDLLSLGDIVFKAGNSNAALIRTALDRLRRVIEIIQVTESRNEDGDATYLIVFIDRETRSKQEVTING